jgi:hypothetical protein
VGFIQIIEIETTRSVEVEALVDEWRVKTAGKRTAQRGTFTKDRDRPNTYVQVVEFPSYEDAMANSVLPETAYLAEKMRELCDGPLVFRNLDVQRVEEL